MAAMSLMKILGNVAKNGLSLAGKVSTREMSGHRLMPIRPSRYHWERFKDLLHFYVMVGAIPATGLILYCNLFIGPAKLAEIPEGYTPEEHEYYSHPITRFMAKHMARSYQQEYEMFAQFAYEEEYKMKLKQAEKRVRAKMIEKKDVQSWYYGPVTNRYHHFGLEQDEKTAREGGTR